MWRVRTERGSTQIGADSRMSILMCGWCRRRRAPIGPPASPPPLPPLNPLPVTFCPSPGHIPSHAAWAGSTRACVDPAGRGDACVRLDALDANARAAKECQSGFREA